MKSDTEKVDGVKLFTPLFREKTQFGIHNSPVDNLDNYWDNLKILANLSPFFHKNP